MTAPLDSDLLRTFAAIVDSGSFTRAAEHVHRTQSAVSMQMKRLEETVGKPLFVRDGRSIALTHDGEKLIGYARRILRLHDEALSHFAEPEVAGTVRVGTPDDYALTLLPALFARFIESYPRVHLEVTCDSSERLQEALNAGELDLSIVTLRPGEDGVVLREEPVVWATSAQHDVHLADPVPLALFNYQCIFRIWGLEALDRVDRDYRVALTSRSYAALSAAVLAGMAVTPIAESSLLPGMRVLRPEEGYPPLPMARIGLAESRNAASPAQARLSEHILRSMRERAPVAA